MSEASEEQLDTALVPDPPLRDGDLPSSGPRNGFRGSSTDDGFEVHVLEEFRPAPPLGGALSSVPLIPAQQRPLYDPFTARRRPNPEWLVSYTTALLVGDAAAAATAVLVLDPFTGALPGSVIALAGLGILVWPALLLALGTYTERYFGTGASEYRRVATGGVVATAVAGYAAQMPAYAGLTRLLLIGVPVATVLTLVNRVLNRWRLHSARRQGRMTKNVVLVGRDVAVVDLARRLQRDPTAGLHVVGACIPRPAAPEALERHGIPVLGGLDEVLQALDTVGADAVVVASASETAGQYLRDLSWQLEGTNIDVIVGPGLVEVAPHRLQLRPTMSIPLLQVRAPEYRGHRRVIKSIFDRAAAAAVLLLCAPLFMLIGAAVRLTSRGPALYRQRRIGKRGRPFDMLKFRSMVVDADRDLDGLLERSEGNAVLFKLRNDPRVTRVGRFLRRYSLDELPQVINVLRGEMSFVGPRPALDREVACYGNDMHRRLLVKPGITGLWQVSGRSDLAWDDAVELDVRYVENWSLGLDLAILLRTFRAVLKGPGAY